VSQESHISQSGASALGSEFTSIKLGWCYDRHPHGVLVLEWKRYSKDTPVGFLALELPSGMILHGITLHQKKAGPAG